MSAPHSTDTADGQTARADGDEDTSEHEPRAQVSALVETNEWIREGNGHE
jgi:hypothetical protein